MPWISSAQCPLKSPLGVKRCSREPRMNEFATCSTTVRTIVGVVGLIDRKQAGIGRKQTGTGRQQTGIDRKQTGIDRQQTGAGRKQSGIDRKQTGIGRKQTGIGRKQTGIGRKQIEIDRQQTGTDRKLAGTGRKQTGTGRQQTGIERQQIQNPKPRHFFGHPTPAHRDLCSISISSPTSGVSRKRVPDVWRRGKFDAGRVIHN
jgi:hypothetical protein